MANSGSRVAFMRLLGVNLARLPSAAMMTLKTLPYKDFSD
jgi:hypothetical protein